MGGWVAGWLGGWVAGWVAGWLEKLGIRLSSAQLGLAAWAWTELGKNDFSFLQFGLL